MIGHLQSNKTAKAAEIFHAIDSIDSAKLAQRSNDSAQEAGQDARRAHRDQCRRRRGQERPRARFAGARRHPRPGATVDEPAHPRADDRAAVHRRSRRRAPILPQAARNARPTRNARHLPSVTLDALSMGMSHDFEVAIEEGSTCVRIGTAIFGVRLKP